MPTLLIILAGLLVVGAGLLTVTQRNPVRAALCMLVALAGVGALMLGLRSPFLAAMQVLLYGGAIMVLFTFVIMLLTLREDEMGPEPSDGSKLGAAFMSLLTLSVLWFGISRRGGASYEAPRLGEEFGSAQHFSTFLYTDYVVAFELVTVLVLAAVAGVIVLGRSAHRTSLEQTKIAGPGEEAHS
ncbi:MAG: NADH-quinone oxidoreductase subunit J [Planctomycetes bacterium]|nr:NADH-quinone oxidoreductase subunit J [Planctomycetota bacterium]